MKQPKFSHGGARPGAGRPPSGNVTVCLYLKPEMRNVMRRLKGPGQTRGHVVEEALVALEKARNEAEFAEILG
jgi:hypothetical protein